MERALYTRWRPAVWAEVKYQEHVVRTLQNAISANKVGHAYIFSGPRGTGKTTAARLLAKAVNCTAEPTARPCDKCDNCVSFKEGRYLDLIEIDAASHTGVDDARDLIEKVRFTPSMGGTYKVYIIDEVHMLSKAAFNALLKTIEEPPPHVIFILATTELDKVMPTILSRCQRFEFRRFPLNEISQHLGQICKAEKIDADEEALVSISRNSAGGMRDAISLLDQLSATGERITIDLVQRILGTAANEAVMQTIDAVIAHDAATAINLAHEVLDRGASANSYSKQMLDHLRNVLLVQTKNVNLLDVTANVKDVLQRHASLLTPLQTIEYIKEFNQAINESKTGISPTLIVETTLAKLATTQLATAQSAPAVAVTAVPQANVATQTTTDKNLPLHRESPPNATSQQLTVETAEKPQIIVEQKTPLPATPPIQEKSSKNNQPQTENLQAAPAEIAPERLKQACRQIYEALKNKGDSQYAGLFNSSSSITYSNRTITLAFKGEINPKKFEAHQDRSFITEQFRAIFGPDIEVRSIEIRTEQNQTTDTTANTLTKKALELGGRLVE